MKAIYTSPTSKVIALGHVNALCSASPVDTEMFTVSGESLTDSDFE